MLSHNLIADFTPISACKSLIYLDLEFNLIKQPGQLERLKYFQKLNLADNKIEEINSITQPALEWLNLNNNYISTLQSPGGTHMLSNETLPLLKTLELRGNKLATIEDLSQMRKLEKLFLAQNKFVNLEGIEKFTNLKVLHLRSNLIKRIVMDNLSSLKALEYLNLRGNYLRRFSDLQAFDTLPSLKRLNIMENPIAEKEDYRQCAVAIIKRLKILDKERISKSERKEALEYIETKDFAEEDAVANQEEAQQEIEDDQKEEEDQKDEEDQQDEDDE
ncbi:hypothetical protein Ciccas_001901 [Cichlidogyrus casuarinus]|uniref:Leucine-rich repeat-containing protein 23 n=1 Tax=Cichlidogyrus casuarinus TaxID=1844966 RepID=A0ABD2QIQ4_9PLAT